MAYQFQQPYLGWGGGLQTLHGASGAVGGWKELGRTTLGSAGDTIDVTSLADKRYYMILGNMIPTGTVNTVLRLNSDTGTNYAWRYSQNGGADATDVSRNLGLLEPNTFTTPNFNVDFISNLSTKEKLWLGHNIIQNTAGAGTAPERAEIVGKWANTTDAINAISQTNTTTGGYLTGSEVVVLGWDPADTHTDNFWEELASVDLSGGASTSLSTGTFTAKKYLWVQIFSKKGTSSTIQPSLKVGTGGTIATGSPYSFRWSNNGASDPTPSVNLAMCPIAWLGADVHFSNTFIINNSGNEKLFINHSVANVTAGAGTAPQRVESVGKFANTSGQINIIDLYDWDSRSLGTETIMKVWGSD